MMCRHLAVGALALAMGSSCDSKSEAEANGGAQGVADAKPQANEVAGAQVAGKATAKVDADVAADAAADVDVAADVKPQIGGTIIATGDFNVEILAFLGGRIEAVIMDAKGALVADTGKLVLGVTLAAKGDARADVDLKWDAELTRFVGQVDAGIELVPGPVEIELVVDGKASVGTWTELALAADASHGGQIMVAGAYSLELVAEAGFVHAYVFDASAKAHAAGDLDLDLDLDGAGKLDLKWDPPSASYKAQIEGGLEGKLDLAAQPLIVRVAADGKVAFAAVQSFHASANLAMKAGADVHADVQPPAVNVKHDLKADAKAKASASAKAGANVDTDVKAVNGKKSATSKGSVKIGDGIKASGSAKAGFKIGS